MPDGDINRAGFLITIEHQGGDRWAALHCGFCFSASGTSDVEAIPSESTDDWLIDHRFPLDEAFWRAKSEAAHVKVNGHTVAEVLARTSA
ncbi:hypothetical protein [Streptomyces tsukubensis]|uniref:hypothetical protein n=1 Tax=Streptomyces tsukubensis TaxID=83656 RepID=UPI00344ECA4D